MRGQLRILAWAFAAIISSTISNPCFAKPQVIVISIDGLGTKLFKTLSSEELPALSKIAQQGVSAQNAETVLKAQTIPAHVSMLTGVDVAKHGLIENELSSKLGQVTVPTIFDLVKQSGLIASAIFGKEKLRFVFDTGALQTNLSPTLWPFGDFWGRLPFVVSKTATEILQNQKPDLLFIHYALVDTTGHAFGWESWIQKRALKQVDHSIAEIVKILEESSSDSVLIVTADHGGHDGSHGQTIAPDTLESPESDLKIPWMAYRPHGKLTLLDSPGDRIKLYDTATTIAALLKLEVPSSWKWDGKNRLQ